MAGRTPEETDAAIGEALGRGDIDAVLDLFEPDAVFVVPDDGAELRGHDEIRAGLEAMFEGEPPTLEAAGKPVVYATGDVALVLSGWVLTAPDGQGGSERQTGAATDVMRRQPDGTWRYVIDNPAGVARL